MGGCVSRQSGECDGAVDFDCAPMPQPLAANGQASSNRLNSEPELHQRLEQQIALFRQSNSSQQLCQSRPRSSNTTPVPLIVSHNNNNNSSSSSRASSLKKLHQVSSNGLQQLAQCQQQQQQQSTRIVAKFDYSARTEDEITFCAGDVMYLINAVDPVWWYVEHRTTRSCGYAPVDLLAKGNSLDSKCWFAGPLARKEAERLLLSAENPSGTFMIRESSTVHGELRPQLPYLTGSGPSILSSCLSLLAITFNCLFSVCFFVIVCVLCLQ
uniref:SH3 domain-containing protein n=1 Tax=Macrostomum lignano TaxID=282301 RepID=A0A1I8IX03_9PLAT